VGWVTQDPHIPSFRLLSRLAFGLRFKVAYLSRWINRHNSRFQCELYNPQRQYDVVVFLKTMGSVFEEEARRIQTYGGKVIFGNNVNYYEVWGDYFVPFTMPSETLQHDAIAMTTMADWVIADSSYVAERAKRYNSRVTWIPDNVSLEIFNRVRNHVARERVVVVWSGIPRKARHLLHIAPALANVGNIELWLVSGQVGDTTLSPDVLAELTAAANCRIIPFTERKLAHVLPRCDIMISPKRLCNAYEMGHTENKIAFGMAAGLPIVASPQPSYVEALAEGGGFIADSTSEWTSRLNELCGKWQLRRDMGRQGRKTVTKRYSTVPVAKQYLDVFQRVLN
jgi:glycosyltransferase involved in cell wall biosynthesis